MSLELLSFSCVMGDIVSSFFLIFKKKKKKNVFVFSGRYKSKTTHYQKKDIMTCCRMKRDGKGNYLVLRGCSFCRATFDYRWANGNCFRNHIRDVIIREGRYLFRVLLLLRFNSLSEFRLKLVFISIIESISLNSFNLF